jgi:hypothetical protein
MKKTQKLENAIIEINDVEYLIKPEVAKLIKEDFGMIPLERLFDNKKILFSLDEVKMAISRGVVDWL